MICFFLCVLCVAVFLTIRNSRNYQTNWFKSTIKSHVLGIVCVFTEIYSLIILFFLERFISISDYSNFTGISFNCQPTLCLNNTHTRTLRRASERKRKMLLLNAQRFDSNSDWVIDHFVSYPKEFGEHLNRMESVFCDTHTQTNKTSMWESNGNLSREFCACDMNLKEKIGGFHWSYLIVAYNCQKHKQIEYTREREKGAGTKINTTIDLAHTMAVVVVVIFFSLQSSMLSMKNLCSRCNKTIYDKPKTQNTHAHTIFKGTPCTIHTYTPSKPSRKNSTVQKNSSDLDSGRMPRIGAYFHVVCVYKTF